MIVWRTDGRIWWFWTVQPDGTLGYPLGHQPHPPGDRPEPGSPFSGSLLNASFKKHQWWAK